MRKLVSHFFALLLLLVLADPVGAGAVSGGQGSSADTDTVERMAVTRGTVTMGLDAGWALNDGADASEGKREMRFNIRSDSFCTVLVFNRVLRAIEAGSMGLVRTDSAAVVEPLNASADRLVIERAAASEPFEFVLRDEKTGLVFFQIGGSAPEYNAAARKLTIKDGQLLMSDELAKRMGRPADGGKVAGRIAIEAWVAPIEVTTFANGAAQSSIMPPRVGNPDAPNAVPGPDVIVGEVRGIFQFGSAGSQVGLAVGTTSCNNGNLALNWFQLPSTDHPVIPQGLYRMSGGPNNDQRFEQIGQSWAKHAFYAFQDNDCGFGCSPASTGSQLGPGCSDPYDASLNATQESLGSRAWINPFTGAFSASAAEHGNHTHNGVTHRVLVEAADLNTTMNPGAKYFAEAQYVTPHEYAWCQSHPTQCNMFNNTSYRQVGVTGATNFSFTNIGATVRTAPAISAWTGATISTIQPPLDADGRAFLAYRVTGPVGGVWHYEYAIFNQNMDRAIRSFSLPLGCGIAVSNLGFHAPLNHPGIASDGTAGDAGFSNAAWTSTQTGTALTWNTETFAQNPNANALRWGTLYNFRFDSNRPPQAVNATIGFFKTGDPMAVGIQGPSPETCNALQLTSAASRKTHGNAGDFEIALPLTDQPGVECRDGGGNHAVVVTFSNTLASGNASVTTGVGSVVGTPTFSGNTMTVNLTGVTDKQKVIVTLSNVTDSFAQVMPDTPVSINMLIGDTNGNKSVNTSDIGETKAQSGAAASASNFRIDVNASGMITASDVSQVKANAGNNVP